MTKTEKVEQMTKTEKVEQMTKTEKQIRLCMRIMHKLIRRWYEEQGITRGSGPYGPSGVIEQYGSFTIGYSVRPVCYLTLQPTKDQFIDWDERQNVI